jgi:hypothetical protein
MSSNHNPNDQRSNTMKFSNSPAGMTKAQIEAGIDEAFAKAVGNGLIVPTGETKWSERKQRMIPIYKRVHPDNAAQLDVSVRKNNGGAAS